MALAARAGNVMLGICAADTAGAVAALKAWTTGLGLPRRLLHGLDTAGKPVTIDGCACGWAHALLLPRAADAAMGACFAIRPVFIKYNSVSGDAFASGYGGDARGVLFTPGLPDGVFRRVPPAGAALQCS